MRAGGRERTLSTHEAQGSAVLSLRGWDSFSDSLSPQVQFSDGVRLQPHGGSASRQIPLFQSVTPRNPHPSRVPSPFHRPWVGPEWLLGVVVCGILTL